MILQIGEQGVASLAGTFHAEGGALFETNRLSLFTIYHIPAILRL